MNRSDLGAELKRSNNCCQAVLLAFEDLLPYDKESLLMLGSTFGSGNGGMMGTCGALVGAVQMAGLALEGKNTMRSARMLAESFARQCGAVRCRDLKGKGAGAPLCACEDCVRNAIYAYGEIVGLKDTEPSA